MKRGFTLTELVVASFIGLLALGVLVEFFILFNRQSDTPMASMSMEQSTLYVMRMLHRDLSETNLQSLRTLPDQSGVCLESPRDSRDFLKIGSYGVVQWQKFVSYQVRKYDSQALLPSGTSLGHLVYDETTTGLRTPGAPPGADVPSLAPDAPFASPSQGRQRNVAHNVRITAEGMGCFVYWPDSEGNAQPFTDSQRGEPVCVHLSLLDISSRTGKPTTRELFLKVKPRN